MSFGVCKNAALMGVAFGRKCLLEKRQEAIYVSGDAHTTREGVISRFGERRENKGPFYITTAIVDRDDLVGFFCLIVLCLVVCNPTLE